jgi:hypothetical protein
MMLHSVFSNCSGIALILISSPFHVQYSNPYTSIHMDITRGSDKSLVL